MRGETGIDHAPHTTSTQPGLFQNHKLSMALLQLSSSPSPRPQRTSNGDCSKHILGQVPPKPVICPQKIKRIGAFADKADCKDAHFDVATKASCIQGYGEPLHSNGGCVMETLTMGELVSSVHFQGFRKIHKKLANPYEVNNWPDVNPNVLNDNPNGFNAYSQLSFNGGDDSGKGSGSGGQGGGHNFGQGGHFDRHDSGLAILGMHALFLGIDEGKVLDHKAAFDSLESLRNTFVSKPASAGGHAKQSNDNEVAVSEAANIVEPEIDGLDQNPKTVVDDQDIVRIGRPEIHAIEVDNDYGKSMTDLPAHNVYACPSLLNDGLNEKASEKTSDPSYICSTCSSRTNSLPSDMAAETYKHYQRLYTFLVNVCRHVSHVGWKVSEEIYDVSVNIPTQVDAMHGNMPPSDQDDEIQLKTCNLEGAMDSAESGQDMKLLSFQPSEVMLDEGVSSRKQRFFWESVNDRISSSSSSSSLSSSAHVQMATAHEPQGVMGWFGQLVHPAIAKHADSHGDTSKAEQVTQHESRVSSSEGVTTAPEVDSQSSESETPSGAKQSDIDALRRLQRETFSELMKLREKLEQLAQARQKLDRIGAARTHLNGQVKAGTAFVLLEDNSSRHARDSLEQAGMQTGLDVKFTFKTPFREKDVLITQCLSGQGSSVGDGRALGGPLSVGKVHYVAHVNDDVSFSFVPLGAEGKDVTEIINVLQDQGLTAFSSQGPALFNHCKGSALGATVSGSRFAFSLAQYLSGWGNHVSGTGSLPEEDPLCLSTLGQFLLQPTEGFVLSLSGLNRYWPSPPLPSSMALHWSEMGPLVIPKIQSFKENQLHMVHIGSDGKSLLHMNSIGSHWEAPDLEYGANAFDNKGTGLLSLAVASSIDLGENLSVSGWAQIERGELLQASDRGNVQWALSLAKTSGSGIDWGASIGGSRPHIWSISTNNHDCFSGNDFHGPQLHVEVFLKLNCGRGFTLQPGVLYVSNKHSRTPAFVVRSSWSL